MTIDNLKALVSAHGAIKLFVKRLAPNDNSKNQVYFARGSFELLNILPIGAIKNEGSGHWKRERFKASLDFSWINDVGQIYPAPNSQLILYPDYPEIRFSGFLLGCQQPPSELMNSRFPNRLLFFAVTNDRRVLGFVASADSEIAQEFNRLVLPLEHGIFSVIELPAALNSKQKLLAELKRIHEQGWIKSKRLDANSNIMPCESSNCGGYTLEAELGITPNGFSQPDYLGWEVKQYGVSNLKKLDSKIITLMTPEPTHGFYVSDGKEAFIKRFGYPDKSGKADRLNFSSVHKFGIQQKNTKLELKLIGFDANAGKIISVDGKISLVDSNNFEAASWSFASLLLHWNRKHNNACYVPSLINRDGDRMYYYSSKVFLGEGTDFQFFLNMVAKGIIYYDPGIKMEYASTKPEIKPRSQFRIKSGNLNGLYSRYESVNLL